MACMFFRAANKALLTCTFLAVFLMTSGTKGHYLNALREEAASGDPSNYLQDVMTGVRSTLRQTSAGEPDPESTKISDLARMVFRFADLSGTTSSHLLEDDEERNRWTLEKISQRLSSERITEALREMAENGKEEAQRMRNSSGGEFESYAGAESWDNECYRGMASFMEPVTDVLLDAALGLLPNDGDGDFIREIVKQVYLRGPTDKTIPDWGLTMLDAFFKLPASLESGNLHWVGGYELCQAQSVSHYYNITLPHEDLNFTGRYCRVDVGRSILPNETASGLLLTLGMCVPSICSEENVTAFLSDAEINRGSTRILGIIQELLEARVEDIFCGHNNISIGGDTTSLAATIVLGVFVILLLLGTLWDGVFRIMWLRKCFEAHAPEPVYNYGGETPPPLYDEITEPSRNLQPSLKRPLSVASNSGLVVNDFNVATMKGSEYWQQSPGFLGRIDLFLVAFSLNANLRKLFSVDRTTSRLRAVDAVKFLSVCYLLLGQTYLLGPIVTFVTVIPNTLPVLQTMLKQWNMMPILGFHFCTDSFFLCSGLLMTMFWFRRIKKNSDKLTPWLIIRNILHLYWRLMPSMMMIMMIFVVYYRFLASGPLAAKSIPFADNCKPNWWTNLLMVQNLVNLDEQCMAWTWYFSAVFQLHLAATVILTIHYFSPLGSYFAMAAVVAAHYSGTAVQTSDILKPGILSSFSTWNNYHYITPWCHAGPYVLGMVLALLLRANNFKAHINFFLRALGWILAVGLIVLVTWIPYDMYKDLDLSKWSLTGQVAYDTLSRTAWSLGVAWIIFASVTGNGGFIGDILSWRVFQPLSKMTYSVYILHAIAILRYMYSRMSLFYVAENEMVYLFFGNLVMSHIYGLICCMLFEYPFRGMEKMVTCRTKMDAMLTGTHPSVTGEMQEDTKPALRRVPTRSKVQNGGVSNVIELDTKM